MAYFDTIKKSLDINIVVSKLFSLPVKAQFCHHLTSSFAAHKALDGLYDSINGMKDDIIEKIIGYSGMKYTELSVYKCAGYKETMNKEVAKEVMDFGKELEEWAAKQGWCDIENLAQSYSGEGAKCLYLLNLS